MVRAERPTRSGEPSSTRPVHRPPPSHHPPVHAHKMSADPLRPFPPLPLEIKGEILAHADTDSLAKACSVSLAFLQLAAPLLYRHITFEGPEGLEDFLTLRVSVVVISTHFFLRPQQEN
jgi:hypothetical protein